MAEKNEVQRKMPIWYTVIIITILGSATGITLYHLYQQPQMMRSDHIAQDVQELGHVFTKINETCSIISFDRVQSYIDFLNVAVFKGSEVGPMNVRYPDEWQGPYLMDNPTIQGVNYMVLVTDAGHYVVPGEGVTLSNGKTIGTDITLAQDTDVSALASREDGLMHNGKALAVQIPVDG